MHYAKKVLNKNLVKEKLTSSFVDYVRLSGVARYEFSKGRLIALSRWWYGYRNLPHLFKKLLRISEDINLDICKVYKSKANNLEINSYEQHNLDLQLKDHNKILNEQLIVFRESKEKTGKVLQALMESHKWFYEEIAWERLDSLESIMGEAVKNVIKTI